MTFDTLIGDFMLKWVIVGEDILDVLESEKNMVQSLF